VLLIRVDPSFLLSPGKMLCCKGVVEVLCPARISHQPRFPCMRGAKQGAIVVLCTFASATPQVSERSEIGWPLVDIVYDFQMKVKYVYHIEMSFNL
jgi:hypothetical protein